MELLLNVVWLIVALAAFGHAAACRRRRAALLATLCLVALLFPIISITDDLTASATAAEESAALRRVAVAASQIIVAVALTFVAFVDDERFSLPAAPALTSHALRGPPSEANAHARRHDEGMKVGLQRIAPSFGMRLERRLERKELRVDAGPPAAA